MPLKTSGVTAQYTPMPSSQNAYRTRGLSREAARRPPSHAPIAMPPMYVASTVYIAVAVLPNVSASDFENTTSYMSPANPDSTNMIATVRTSGAARTARDVGVDSQPARRRCAGSCA